MKKDDLGEKLLALGELIEQAIQGMTQDTDYSPETLIKMSAAYTSQVNSYLKLQEYIASKAIVEEVEIESLSDAQLEALIRARVD
jgi:hypothetical protein